jgi:hypothetical protein
MKRRYPLAQSNRPKISSLSKRILFKYIVIQYRVWWTRVILMLYRMSVRPEIMTSALANWNSQVLRIASVNIIKMRPFMWTTLLFQKIRYNTKIEIIRVSNLAARLIRLTSYEERYLTEIQRDCFR